MPRPLAGRVVLVAAALVLLLSGCAPAPAATPHRTAPPLAAATSSFSGTGARGGAAEHTVKVPRGAHSIRLTVTCAGSGDIAVQLPPPTESLTLARHGECGGTQQWTLPTAAGRSSVGVIAPVGALYIVEVAYSAERIRPDAAITADCAAWSRIASELFDADQGLDPRNAAWDASGWRTRVDAAVVHLRALAASAARPLKAAFAAELPRLAASDLTPGTANRDDVQTAIADRCDTNGTDVQISAQFGG